MKVKKIHIIDIRTIYVFYYTEDKQKFVKLRHQYELKFCSSFYLAELFL